jgi:hypothetical protein
MRRGDAAAAAAPAPASAADAIEDADDYHRQLLVVRRLHDAGASRERVAAAAATIRALKAKTWVPRGTTSRKKKRAKLAAGGLQDASGAGDDATAATAATDARAVATYPPPDLPPVDADGFVLAFDAPSIAPGVEPSNARAEDVRMDADAIAHWRRYGFVVFRDVLTREECAATRDEIWDYLEATHRHRGAALSRDDANTWHALSSDTYGLAPEPSVFTPRCVMNRQNPKVIACLAAALSSFPDGDAGDGGGDDADAARVSVSPRDVIVSQDRWCLYRPTRGLSLRRRPSADDDVENGRETTVTTTELVDKPEWKTRGNLHLDLNPFTYGDDALNARALDDDDDVSVSVSDTNVAGNDGHVDDAIGPRAKADRLPFEHARDFSKETNAVSAASGAFYTLVPIRPRWRGERRSLRTFPGVSLRPPLVFNPRPRCLSTPTDAFQLHPDIALYGTTLRAARPRRHRARGQPRRGRRHGLGPRVPRDVREVESRAGELVAGVRGDARGRGRESVGVARRRRRVVQGAFSLHWSPYDPVRAVNADP